MGHRVLVHAWRRATVRDAASAGPRPPAATFASARSASSSTNATQTEYTVYRGEVDEAIGPKVPVAAFLRRPGRCLSSLLEKLPTRPRPMIAASRSAGHTTPTPCSAPSAAPARCTSGPGGCSCQSRLQRCRSSSTTITQIVSSARCHELATWEVDRSEWIIARARIDSPPAWPKPFAQERAVTHRGASEQLTGGRPRGSRFWPRVGRDGPWRRGRSWCPTRLHRCWPIWARSDK